MPVSVEQPSPDLSIRERPGPHPTLGVAHTVGRGEAGRTGLPWGAPSQALPPPSLLQWFEGQPFGATSVSPPPASWGRDPSYYPCVDRWGN